MYVYVPAYFAAGEKSGQIGFLKGIFMKKSNLTQRVLLGLLLILLSVFCYSLHYVVFRNAHHIFIYLLGDIAFVFIEVLLVTLIIHHLLGEREKRAMLKKLNMVIGAF